MQTAQRWNVLPEHSGVAPLHLEPAATAGPPFFSLCGSERVIGEECGVEIQTALRGAQKKNH